MVNNHVTLLGRLASFPRFTDEGQVRYARFDLVRTEVDDTGGRPATRVHLHRVSCRYYETELSRDAKIGDFLVVHGSLVSRLRDEAGNVWAVHEVHAREVRLLRDVPHAAPGSRFDAHVMLVGRLATVPEHFDENDFRGARFDLATTQVYARAGKAKLHTQLHRVVCWYHPADACQRGAVGDAVVVQGTLWSRTLGDDGQEHAWDEVRAHGVQLIGLLPGAPS